MGKFIYETFATLTQDFIVDLDHLTNFHDRHLPLPTGMGFSRIQTYFITFDDGTLGQWDFRLGQDETGFDIQISSFRLI